MNAKTAWTVLGAVLITAGLMMLFPPRQQPCVSKDNTASVQPMRCRWVNHPEFLWPVDNWECAVKEEFKGTVRATRDSVVYYAFVGGAPCRSGEFASLEAAKKCVEENIK